MKVPVPPSTTIRAASTAGIANSAVFVYGSLMSPSVVKGLIGRVPDNSPSSSTTARLWGYARHPVKQKVYPAIIPASSSNSSRQSFVDGMIWQGLTDSELKAFDWFEDDDYERTRVPVELLLKICTESTSKDKDTNSQTSRIIVKMDAYIWANPSSELEVDQEWSFDAFCREHLDWYLTHTVGPCREELDRLALLDDEP